MRPSTTFKPPGVYPSQGESVRDELTPGECDIAGFVGVAQKGPLNEPVRLASWDDFVEVFGYESEFYLSASVEAFFRNGGRSCVVVRVAHLPAEGERIGTQHAAAAERVITDDWNKPTLRVLARTPGRWGNNIWVSATHSVGASALLTQDLEVGSGEARVSSTRGFEVGQLVRISDRQSEDYIIITEIVERTIRWGAETPVNRNHKAASPTRLEVLGFDIQVALRERKEVFRNLQLHPASHRYAPRVVDAESRLIRLENLESSSPPPHNFPRPVPADKLAAGRDGSEHLTVEDFVGYDRGPADRAGLWVFRARDDIGVLCCPDAMWFIDDEPGPAGIMKAQRIQDFMLDSAEVSEDRVALIDVPRTRDIEQVKRWRQRVDSSYGAMYWPWLKMETLDGVARDLPPSGIMAGIIARCDREGVHIAPANRPIDGALDLTLRVTETDIGDLNREGVNIFRSFRGIRPWGARTTSSDPDWRHLNIRRVFLMLRRTLRAGMAWVPFETNNRPTWRALTDQIAQLLNKFHEKGMFAPGKAEDAFFVKCDEETNPPDAVDAGLLTVQIGVAPATPTEFIMISVVEQMSSGS
jgi:hypothetical protein